MTKAKRALLARFKVIRHARHGNEQAASVYGADLHLSQIVTLHPMCGDAAYIHKAIAQDKAEQARDTSILAFLEAQEASCTSNPVLL